MLRLLAFALLLAPLTGCPAPAEVTPGEQYPVIEGQAAERSPDLEAARQRWQDADMDGYRMTLQRVCFCPVPDYTGPFAVTVRDGEVASVLLQGAGVDAERGMSVDALFALIDDAYDRGAVEVEVKFDDELGYPTSIGIDYDFQMADEEIGYRVSDLARL